MHHGTLALTAYATLIASCTAWASVSLPPPGSTAAPPPGAVPTHVPKTLTLKEAIFIALRYNPDIEKSEVTWVENQFQFRLARYQIQPQFSLGASSNYRPGNKPVYGITPGASLTTVLGTNVSVGYSNAFQRNSGSTTLSITQPLLKGFGEPQRDWENAITQFHSDGMTYREQVITTVVDVIQSFRTLVEGYSSIEIQKRNLATSKQDIKNSKLRLEAGQIPKSDLIQQKSTYQSNELALVNSQIDIENSKQDFLEKLGIIDADSINIETTLPPIKRYRIPDLNKSIAYALKNNPTYLNAQLTLLHAERTLSSAKNQQLWTLNADLESTLGSPRPFNVPGFNPALAGGGNGSQSLGFTLTVPIHDLNQQYILIQARDALQQAKVDLNAARRTVYNNVRKDIQQIKLAIQNIQLATQALATAQENLKLNRINLQYGRTSQFQVDLLQTQLINQNEQLINQRISYLNAMTSLREYMGTTLTYWHIKLKVPSS
jgi:outer membrane protein TolC